MFGRKAKKENKVLREKIALLNKMNAANFELAADALCDNIKKSNAINSMWNDYTETGFLKDNLEAYFK